MVEKLAHGEIFGNPWFPETNPVNEATDRIRRSTKILPNFQGLPRLGIGQNL
jgi:hypothetical protein